MGKIPIRPVKVFEDYAEVVLTKGLLSIIDLEDVEKVSSRNWCAHRAGGKFYAVSNGQVHESFKKMYLHRFILGAESELKVDHINGDSLDNRRENLRFASVSENLFNRGKTSKNRSGYKGVFWSQEKGRWKAEVGAHGKKHHVGYFQSAEDAYEAYKNLAESLHGDFFNG